MLDCSDALDTFFLELPFLLVKTREETLRDQENGAPPPDPDQFLISRTSPLGIFIRKMSLEYTRLQFHETDALWESFIQYRLPTSAAWVKRNPSYAEAAIDINLRDLSIHPQSALGQAVYGRITEKGVSPEDAERLLEFQIQEMQRRKLRNELDLLRMNQLTIFEDSAIVYQIQSRED